MGRNLAPGNFSHTSLGSAKHAHTGWRQFMFTDSQVTIEDPSSVISSMVETTGNSVATFATTHSVTLDKSPLLGYVGIMPLLTPEGAPLTFGDPFLLRTRIELISISGDSTSTTESSATNKSKPQIAIGIAENASDADSTTNRHMLFGWRCKADSAQSEAIDESPAGIYCRLETDGDGHLVSSFSGLNDGANLFEANFFVGPDHDAADNTHMAYQVFADSNHGTPYDKAGGGSRGYATTSFNTSQGFDAAAGQAYIYACVSDCNTVSSASSACVVTFRLWYMVEADIARGWGTL
tara:strand:- start:1059 stop:1940 length:882 start_codon:yes stop_codon:yes gene_type:complete